MASIDRRRFLALSAGALSGLWVAGCSSSGGASPDGGTSSTGAAADGSPPVSSAAAPSPGAAPAATKAPSGKAARRLVVVELDGGNDGMSTLVPHGMAGYGDLRKRTRIDEKDLVEFGGGSVALHKNLKGMKDRGLAVIQGVGTGTPDGSHFAMMERWWRGDVNGTASPSTGFLGRLCDQLSDPAARVTGLSFGAANHLSMLAARASTLSLPGAGSAGYVAGADEGNRTLRAFQDALAQMSSTERPDSVGAARRGMRDAISVGRMLQSLAEEKEAPDYPGSHLGQSLRLTARLLAADPLVRVVHVPMGADFDTHQDHPGRHAGLLQELNDAVVAFVDDLKARGLDDQVLVATTSEFGRTARDNGSNGLDHGTASVALLCGPVKQGVHGEHPSLTKLDEDDQLVATIGFDQYYATLAESWLGIPSSEVLPGKAQPLAGIVG